MYELLYEYYDKVERDNALHRQSELEADKIEDAKMQSALDWAAEEERKEKAEKEEKAKQEADEKWMIEQLKKEHGDDFGENI